MGKLDEFTLAYIECMLWSTSAEIEPTPDLSLMDHGYDLSSIDAETLEHIAADCEAFQRNFAEVIADDTQAGHDFWLDRNGHGAGALDRSCDCDDKHLPSHCPRNMLRHAGAVYYGHLDAYLGDDDRIYLTPDPLSAMQHARRLDKEECAVVDAYLERGEMPKV